MFIHGEPNEGWRLYTLNWIVLSMIALLLSISIAVSRFSVEIESGLLKTIAMAAVFTLAGRYLISHRWGARPALVLLSLAQLDMLFLFGTPLSYVTASADLPLQDGNLAHLDQLLGLDWTAYYRFIVDRPALLPYAVFFYAMIGWLGLGVPLLLGLTKNHVRLHQFTMACILTVCVTALISALLPAIGTYQEYRVPAETPNFRATGYLIQFDRLPLVRDGSLRLLNVSQLGGIITFPSFHAAAAILAVWACWGVWWIRPLALITNAGMLLATPLVGGHYFVDVIAGSALAVLGIAAAKSLGTRWAAAGQRREIVAPLGSGNVALIAGRRRETAL
ncbi:phosphatase PAP2 family protein [Bradyrhizobium sp. ARR65]|uniref:phosphatase PAP2 family protein n=1 Tax=Bradyrhizobium sp. ARR65 TaxID=1040989 RepID=UPI00046456E2|nr:phosphatase PAP2 family protein [Bradyrhizobium sp. ARR65]